MARHSFVTDLEVQRNWAGLVKGIQPDQKTVEILSRSDVRKIVLEVIDEEVWDKLKSKERKITKVGEQAETAVKDAKVARKEIQRFVETARETFRDVIDELLVPHYRFLAQHLGIELSDQLTRETSKNRTVSTRKAASAAKTPVTSKKKTAVSRSVRKGVKAWKK